MFKGWFQQKEKLDLSGKAITYRIIVSLIVFGLALVLKRRLIFPCIVLLLNYIISFIIYNIRYSIVVGKLKKRETWKKHISWVVKMALEGLPLFINCFLMMSI